MLKLLFLKLWPALIPLGFYLVWTLVLARRMPDGQRVAEHVRRGLLFWAIMASAVLLIGSFIWLAVTREANTQGTYVPPHMQDGVLVPGQRAPAHGSR